MPDISVLVVDEIGVDRDGKTSVLLRHSYVCGPGGGPIYAGLDGSTVVGAVAAWLGKTIHRRLRPGGEPALPTIKVELTPTPNIDAAEGFIPHTVREGKNLAGVIALTEEGGAASPVVDSPETLEEHRPQPQSTP